MSGYNSKTGHFDLTATQANYWLRRPDIPEECGELSGIERACCVLRHHGIAVVAVHKAWAEIDAKQAQIWEALSGQPSNPERAAYHDKKQLGKS